MRNLINSKKEINKVLSLIKEKTNVTIPVDIIFVEKTDYMKSHATVKGTYFENRISLNPKIFEVRTDREYYREKAKGEIIYIGGKHSRIDTEDKLTEYMNEVIENTILWRKIIRKDHF